MPNSKGPAIDPRKVICIVMGGGGGKGLFPLTRDRATPAVPLAGNYRLVDLPLSNCINSGLSHIYILTQFNSASLHRHVAQAYKFDQFSDGFVEIRAAQQTFTDSSWYQGTADAVRKNLEHFLQSDFDYALVLSADQLYRMDFRAMLAQHVQSGAELTIATAQVPASKAQSLGILQMDQDCRVSRFVEKPEDPALLESLKMDPSWPRRPGDNDPGDRFTASMGMYVFNRNVLQELLNNSHSDFGRHIIPEAIGSRRVFAHLFQGYWGDVGTIGTFFEANLDLVSELPHFNFFDLAAPIFSQPLYLPGAKINGAKLDHAMLAGGCIVNEATITQSVIGLRTCIGAGSKLHRVVSLGYDDYESQESIETNEKLGLPRLGIGRNTRIENTIVDRNARIGDHVVISPAGKPASVDHEQYFIRDGVVIIPRNGTIPHGTTI